MEMEQKSEQKAKDGDILVQLNLEEKVDSSPNSGQTLRKVQEPRPLLVDG